MLKLYISNRENLEKEIKASYG